MSDQALLAAAISWAREFLEDYPRDVSVEAFVEVGAIRVLLAEAARREALERALRALVGPAETNEDEMAVENDSPVTIRCQLGDLRRAWAALAGSTGRRP